MRSVIPVKVAAVKDGTSDWQLFHNGMLFKQSMGVFVVFAKPPDQTSMSIIREPGLGKCLEEVQALLAT